MNDKSCLSIELENIFDPTSYDSLESEMTNSVYLKSTQIHKINSLSIKREASLNFSHQKSKVQVHQTSTDLKRKEEHGEGNLLIRDRKQT